MCRVVDGPAPRQTCPITGGRVLSTLSPSLPPWVVCVRTFTSLPRLDHSPHPVSVGLFFNNLSLCPGRLLKLVVSFASSEKVIRSICTRLDRYPCLAFAKCYQVSFFAACYQTRYSGHALFFLSSSRFLLAASLPESYSPV